MPKIIGQHKKDPTIQKFLSGSGTYITPSNVSYIKVTVVGGGGGGAGASNNGTNNTNAGSNGLPSNFGSLIAGGGNYGIVGLGGLGGSNTVTGFNTIINARGGAGGYISGKARQLTVTKLGAING